MDNIDSVVFSKLSLSEAVEALTSISEVNFEKNVHEAGPEEIIAYNQIITALTAPWLGKENPDEAVLLIRSTLSVIYRYLQQYHRQHPDIVDEWENIERIKGIMVIVGEAMTKLSEYTTIVQETEGKSPLELDEFQELKEFYATRIAKKIDENLLGKWILELTKKAVERGDGGELAGKSLAEIKHLFMDFEAVKQDKEYELLMIRKEGSSHFYNPQLIRNIKLTCGFAAQLSKKRAQDPLGSMREWSDHACQVAAKCLLEGIGNQLDLYFKVVKTGGNHELVKQVNDAIFSLMLAANPENSIKNRPVKSCIEYFADFRFFLRKSLLTNEYQRMLAYPPKRSSHLLCVLLDTVHQISWAYFTQIKRDKVLLPLLEPIFMQALESSAIRGGDLEEVGNKIAATYMGMTTLMKEHPYGPLHKVLELMRDEHQHFFDPIYQTVIPNQLFLLHTQERPIHFMRLPSPTIQEYVQNARIIPEFKAFIHENGKLQPVKSHLLINLQDRTSWKEYARSIALEEMQELFEYAHKIHVVTLSKHSDFYHQDPPYDKNTNTVFFDQLVEHILDDSCGYFFPDRLEGFLHSASLKTMIQGIDQLFFNGKKVLNRKEKCVFIDLTQLFLSMKLLDYYLPDSCSCTCKDGIDQGSIFSAELFLLFSFLADREKEPEVIETVNQLIYAAPLIYRERTPHQENIERLIATIRQVEQAKKEFGNENFMRIFEELFLEMFPNRIYQAKAA